MCLLRSRFAVIMACLLLVAQTSSLQRQSPPKETFDGPAELPRIYLRSSLADTPAPGKTRLVKAGDNLQQALNSVSCGDTLQLESGATFAGWFRLEQNHATMLTGLLSERVLGISIYRRKEPV